MPGQPQGTMDWYFDLKDVKVNELGATVIAPSLIINQPNTFTCTAVLKNTGAIGYLLNGEEGQIDYHCERQEPTLPSGQETRLTLGPVKFVKDDNPEQEVVSQPFTLGVGTWHIFAHVHFPGTEFANLVTAFYSFYLMVVPKIPPPTVPS